MFFQAFVKNLNDLLYLLECTIYTIIPYPTMHYTRPLKFDHLTVKFEMFIAVKFILFHILFLLKQALHSMQ